MAKQTINVGTAPNTRSGDTLRAAFIKANENFTELYNLANADVQIPSQTGKAGKVLKTTGAALLFENISYNELTDRPTLFSGSYNDLSNKPLIFSGNYSDLAGRPTLFSGSYNDLSNKPTLFSGSYNDLTNKPTIPTSFSSLVNGNNTVSLGSNGTLTASGSIELKNTLKIKASDVDTLYDNYQSALGVLEEMLNNIGYTGPGYPASKNSYDLLVQANQNLSPQLPSNVFPAAMTAKNAYYSWAAATANLTANAYGFFIENGDGVGWRFEESTGIRFPDNTYQTTAFTGGYISLSTLKTVVAASTDFADFKTRIAAL
jgi:hypothetical protein